MEGLTKKMYNIMVVLCRFLRILLFDIYLIYE